MAFKEHKVLQAFKDRQDRPEWLDRPEQQEMEPEMRGAAVIFKPHRVEKSRTRKT
jgi:hypothetical protein